jgi:hypothetical protein
MATELDSRLWYGERRAPVQFMELVRTISASEICVNNWNEFSIAESAPGKVILEVGGNISLDELQKQVQLHDGNNLKFTVYVSIRCWRFSGMNAEMANVGMAVSCWGDDYGAVFHFDQTLEGHGQISILSVGPYCAIVDKEETEAVKNVNEHVAQNLNDLLDLIQLIVSRIRVEKLLTFSDVGHYALFNVHLAYFAGLDQIRLAIDQFLKMGREGNPHYNIRPWRDIEMSKSFLLHEWRTPEQRQALKERLVSLLGAADANVSTGRLYRVLETGKYDFFDKDGSLIILDYPFFMNAFIAEFFFDLLRNDQ